jgi:cytochrome P450
LPDPARSLDSDAAIHFDPTSRAFTEDPQSFYAAMRERAPVYYWPEGRAWVLTRYDDIDAMLRDARFTTDNRTWRHSAQPIYANEPELATVLENNFFSAPAQEHQRMRKLVAPSFSSRAIAPLERQIRAIVDDLLAQADAGGRDVIDIATALAEPVPIRVISSMLGIPREHDEHFRRWGGSIIQVMFPLLPPERMAVTVAVAAGGLPMLREIIAERRRNPGDDMLSQLIQAQEAGERLSEDELVAMVMIMIAAGSETTVHLITFAVYNLLRHADQRRLVQQDPSLLDNAIEEVLRYDSFGKGAVTRFALEDVVIRGQRIVRGDMIFGYLGSALHDPDVWPDAGRFDVTRDPVANLSFGRGAHYCLGAHLARLEGRVALATLFERFPDMQLAGPPEYDFQHPILRRMSSLPVRPRG